MQKQFLGSILVFWGAVLFGGKAVIVKWLYLHEPIDTLSMLSLRMLFSLPFYIAAVLISGQNKTNIAINARQWLWIIALGFIGYYLASLFDFWGLKYISASIERLVLFIYPTLVLLLTAVFFGKKITKIQYICLAITYLGIVLAFVPDIRSGGSPQLWLGVFLIFLSALTYAMYVAGSGQLIQQVGVNRFTTYTMIVSTIFILCHSQFIGAPLIGLPSQVYIWCAVMAVFCTVIPSYLISAGVKHVGAGNSAIIGSVGPMATIFLAQVFLQESMHFWQIVGSICILLGVVIISIKK
jgi:drug/metabolite transporter (DMT)-like permease